MPRYVCFNVNGIRSRPHQLAAVRERHAPAVIGIQESKVADEVFPFADLAALGLNAEIHGQKGHYGVALLGAQPAEQVIKGLPGDDADAQRRAITGVYRLPDGEHLTLINAYFPQGDGRDHPVKFPAKQRFYAAMAAYLREHFRPEQNLVLMGDMNVAPLDLDIGIGADNAARWLKTGKCSFLPEEREWLRGLTDWGLHDAYRLVHPTVDDRFSWFDYRSRGFEREPRRGLRIDLILISEPLRARLRDASIDYDIRALDRPSDHCPVWIELE